MIYYSWFSGHGRAVLADELGAEDPFALSSSEIVDRVVAAGHRPAIEAAQDQPFPVVGRLDKIERVGVVFFVSISRDAEEIAVQERRDEAYGPARRPGLVTCLSHSRPDLRLASQRPLILYGPHHRPVASNFSRVGERARKRPTLAGRPLFSSD